MFNHTIIDSYTDDAGSVFSSSNKFTGQTEAAYESSPYQEPDPSPLPAPTPQSRLD
jgi:hypothetical protein